MNIALLCFSPTPVNKEVLFNLTSSVSHKERVIFSSDNPMLKISMHSTRGLDKSFSV